MWSRVGPRRIDTTTHQPASEGCALVRQGTEKRRRVERRAGSLEATAAAHRVRSPIVGRRIRAAPNQRSLGRGQRIEWRRRGKSGVEPCREFRGGPVVDSPQCRHDVVRAGEQKRLREGRVVVAPAVAGRPRGSERGLTSGEEDEAAADVETQYFV